MIKKDEQNPTTKALIFLTLNSNSGARPPNELHLIKERLGERSSRKRGHWTRVSWMLEDRTELSRTFEMKDLIPS